MERVVIYDDYDLDLQPAPDLACLAMSSDADVPLVPRLCSAAASCSKRARLACSAAASLNVRHTVDTLSTVGYYVLHRQHELKYPRDGGVD